MTTSQITQHSTGVLSAFSPTSHIDNDTLPSQYLTEQATFIFINPSTGLPLTGFSGHLVLHTSQDRRLHITTQHSPRVFCCPGIRQDWLRHY